MSMFPSSENWSITYFGNTLIINNQTCLIRCRYSLNLAKDFCPVFVHLTFNKEGVIIVLQWAHVCFISRSRDDDKQLNIVSQYDKNASTPACRATNTVESFMFYGKQFFDGSWARYFVGKQYVTKEDNCYMCYMCTWLTYKQRKELSFLYFIELSFL